MKPAPRGSATYRSAGVDYVSLDASKRQALSQALATSALLGAHGGVAVDESRGEPAFVFSLGDRTLAFVLEGLGTKSMIATALEAHHGVAGFDSVAYDTVAAIVNDLCCVGAQPLVVNAYFATGSSDWYERADRQAALLSGWRRACEDAGATWGGGESPSLPELVSNDHIELAGSAVGMLPDGVSPILGQELAAGDEIVFVASTGLHANGASLARLVAGQLAEGYATLLPSGRAYGEALLDSAPMYAPLVQALVAEGVPLHYLSHITGHGMLKLMRPKRPFTYEIDALPEVPEVLSFLSGQADMTAFAAYSTFNMGCGFAIYCARGSGQTVVDIAQGFDLKAHVAGGVEEGPRRVMLKEIDVTYESSEMDLSPGRAA